MRMILEGLRGRLALSAAIIALSIVGAGTVRAATLDRESYTPDEEWLGAAKSSAAKAAPVFTVANPYATSLKNSSIRIGKLTVFGDSYSMLKRKKFPNWAEQLQQDGAVQSIAGFAKSGAVARTDGTNTYKRQYNLWLQSKPTFASNDLTVVYFGYNDIDGYSDLSQSIADYSYYTDKIIQKGALSKDSNRRVFVVLPHDWGKNPAQAADPATYRARTLDWRSKVIDYANDSPGVIAVDLFTAMERVFAKPSRYGFKNITTPNTKLSATTYLYDDANHFGQHGQKLIKQLFSYYLTRGWNAANTLQAGDQAAAQLNQDIDGGLVFSMTALTAEERQGLTAFPVGLGALPQDETVASDVTRAGFDEVYAPDQHDGGVGFNYELGGGTRLGFVISQYGQDVRTEQELATAKGSVRSDSVSVYMQHQLGGFELGTRFIYSDETHQQRLYDEFIGEGDRASFGGRTLELSQRAGYPIRQQGLTFTPWVQLTQRSQSIDSFTLSNPYVSDTTYSASPVNDTEVSLGLDATSDPIALGDKARLILSGGLSYKQSLVRDDYEVKIREAAVQGYTQRQTLDRPELRTLGFNLGAQLQIGERFDLGAGVGVSHDPAEGTAESARVSLAYRF